MTATTQRKRPTFEDKIEFLSRGDSHGVAAAIEVIETHMSWVFLAPERVYKLKKPIARDYFDFSTLAARRDNCRAEVELNRRLAAASYLGVVVLEADSRGQLYFAPEHVSQPPEEGRVVDYLVAMRRLPGERMLDRRIAAGEVERDTLDPVLKRLVALYRRSPPEPIEPAAYRGYFRRTLAENIEALGDRRLGLERSRLAALEKSLTATLDERPALFDQRFAERRIVEAHGDLRPQHICLLEPPQIIDCLEFDRRLRCLDSLDELGFLALECRRKGADDLAEAVIEGYACLSGDRFEPALLAFYQGYRAILRALLAAWHLLDSDCRRPDKWRNKANDYLALAEACTARL